MLNKLSELRDDISQKAKVFLRERKERAETNRALKKQAPHGAAPIIWVWFLSFIAVATLIGSTWMLFVFIAGSVGSVDWAFDWRAGNDGEPARWTWFMQAQIHVLIGIGLACFCLGIAAFNAVWLHVRSHLFGLFRAVVTGLGVLVALFMVSGAIVVQQWGTVARERDEIVATNTARQGVATVQAEIDAIETEMARLCAPTLTTYQAQACRSGEQAWQGRIGIAQQQRDYQLAGIERAIVDAQQGDRWRARLLALRQQHASASVTTVEAEAQQVETTGWMMTFARLLEDIRKPFIAVLGELLAMTMFGVALAAALSRRQTVEQSGWADVAHRIEDKTAEEPIASNPVKIQTQVRATNAETGVEEILIKPKPYWRAAKRGKSTPVDVNPDIPPDETGVEHDGGNRTAITLGGPMDVASATREVEPLVQPDHDAAETDKQESDGVEKEDADDKANDEATSVQPDSSEELPYLSDESGEGELEPPVAAIEEPHADEQHSDRDEPDEQAAHGEPREEPETDPQKLIAAE